MFSWTAVAVVCVLGLLVEDLAELRTARRWQRYATAFRRVR